MPLKKKRALQATVCGEMAVDDVPLAPWVTQESFDELKKGDTDPLQVVVEVPAGKSTRGWNYLPSCLQKIVGEINSTGAPAFLGHQESDKVSTEFPTPVTHWLGAKWENGKAYFRGLIDKSQPDLKRWIRGKVVRQVSIFGYPALQQTSAGETEVVDYKLLSIDWTPLNRAGMPTSIVATGEMNDPSGEIDIIGVTEDDSHEALKNSLTATIRGALGIQNRSGEYLWVNQVYDDYCIAEHETPQGTSFYQYPYSKNDNGTITIGDRTAVKKQTSWVPAGEMEDIVDLNQLVEKYRKGEITLLQLQKACGEMGLTVTMAAAPAPTPAPSPDLAAIGEMFGGLQGTELLAAISEAAKAADSQKKAAHEALISEVMKEKVVGEMAQALVRKMIAVPPAASKEVIAGEIDRVLADDVTKRALASMHADSPLPMGGGSGNRDKLPSYVRVSRKSF